MLFRSSLRNFTSSYVQSSMQPSRPVKLITFASMTPRTFHGGRAIFRLGANSSQNAAFLDGLSPLKQRIVRIATFATTARCRRDYGYIDLIMLYSPDVRGIEEVYLLAQRYKMLAADQDPSAAGFLERGFDFCSVRWPNIGAKLLSNELEPVDTHSIVRLGQVTSHTKRDLKEAGTFHGLNRPINLFIQTERANGYVDGVGRAHLLVRLPAASRS